MIPLYPINSGFKSEPVICNSNFLTEEELDLLGKQLSGVPTKTGLVRSDHKEYDKIARQSRVFFLDNFSAFDWIYKKCSQAAHDVNHYNYKRMLYGIEPMQYSEYHESYKGFYGPHTDEFIPLVQEHYQRSLSFSIQLSNESEYTGGELVIKFPDGQKFTAPKQRGSITFFDSRLEHEVVPVTSGLRKSLVGWVMGPRV